MKNSINRRNFIKLMAGGAILALPRFVSGTQLNNRKPNIVFILIDDMGWTDPGCFGGEIYKTPNIDPQVEWKEKSHFNRGFYETPNINRLAAGGMRFTSGYAAAPVCSPTRASIMTGKYPARLGLTEWLWGSYTRLDSPILPAEYAPYLPLEEITIAEELKQAGYTTCHVGKWHLGYHPYHPENQGFDYNIGGSYSGAPTNYFWPKWGNNPPNELPRSKLRGIDENYSYDNEASFGELNPKRLKGEKRENT